MAFVELSCFSVSTVSYSGFPEVSSKTVGNCCRGGGFSTGLTISFKAPAGYDKKVQMEFVVDNCSRKIFVIISMANWHQVANVQ